ncbi:14283_t:CDS:2, partial [Gigaspora rosea]
MSIRCLRIETLVACFWFVIASFVVSEGCERNRNDTPVWFCDKSDTVKW